MTPGAGAAAYRLIILESEASLEPDTLAEYDEMYGRNS